MSREIKFRAWLPGIKKMTYSHTLEELMNWNTKPEDNGTAVWIQYTGFHDRNGKEIFEGDILRTQYGIFSVSWGEACWYLDNPTYSYDNGDYYYGSEIDWKEVEIIGNIYEHPHLLGEKVEEL